MTVLVDSGRGGLRAAVERAVDYFLRDVDASAGFFLKPNIVFPVSPKSGEITSPMVVRCLVNVLRERFERADIALGEGVAAGQDPQRNFLASGYAELAAELRIPLLDLHDPRTPRVPVAWKFGTLELPSIVFERVYVNLPILKYSSACEISAALKNQKGLLLPSAKKQFHHLGLHEPIAELGLAVRPALTILDCGRFLGEDVVVAGDNCGQIDATVCDLLGIEEPEHVRLARDVGLIADSFRVEGASTVELHAPMPSVQESQSFGRLRLWSNPRACTGCREILHQVRHDAFTLGHLAGKAKLSALCVRGAEVVMGTEPQWRREHKEVICVGSCARRLAAENGYAHIPGCPPTLDDFYDNLP